MPNPWTFDEIAEFLDDMVDALPEQYTRDLQGIYLSPEVKHNDKIPSENYFVMGQFIQTPHFPPRIELYYGSIQAVHGFQDEVSVKSALRKILYHELQHHVETLAGDDSLVREDEKFVQTALHNLNNNRSDTP